MNEPRILTDDLVCIVCAMPWEFCGCLPSDLAAHHAEAAYEIGKQYQHAKRRRMPIWGWVLLAVVSAVLTWFVLPASPETVKEVLRENADLVRGIQWCEKHHWPVTDVQCLGA